MKISLMILLAIVTNFTFGQYMFTIKGKLHSTFTGKKIYLMIWDRYSANRYEFRDSALVKNDSFYFSGFINKISEEAQIYSKYPNGYFRLVVDTGVNEIHIRPVSRNSPFYRNKFSNTEVVNSTSNKILRQIDSLVNFYYLTKGKVLADNPNLVELSKESRRELKNKKLLILKQHSNIYYSLVHLYSMFTSLTTEQLLEVFSTFSVEIKNSPLGKEFYEKTQIKKGAEIGSMVKGFSLRTNAGLIFSNTSLIGRPYIVAFGATWCIPCKENLPFLKQLYNKYKSKGLEVVYVNLDDQTDKWKKQIINDKLNWINVSEGVKWEKSVVVKTFDITSIPFYLIVDKSGRIIYNDRQLADEGMKQIEEYLLSALR